jgi:hypothetical protein
MPSGHAHFIGYSFGAGSIRLLSRERLRPASALDRELNRIALHLTGVIELDLIPVEVQHAHKSQSIATQFPVTDRRLAHLTANRAFDFLARCLECKGICLRSVAARDLGGVLARHIGGERQKRQAHQAQEGLECSFHVERMVRRGRMLLRGRARPAALQTFTAYIAFLAVIV